MRRAGASLDHLSRQRKRKLEKMRYHRDSVENDPDLGGVATEVRR